MGGVFRWMSFCLGGLVGCGSNIYTFWWNGLVGLYSQAFLGGVSHLSQCSSISQTCFMFLSVFLVLVDIRPRLFDIFHVFVLFSFLLKLAV